VVWIAAAEPSVDMAALAETGGALAAGNAWLEAGSVWAKLEAARTISITWARIRELRFMVSYLSGFAKSN